VGKRCLYGVKDVAKSQAYRQCRKIWGKPGPNLWFNEGADAVGMQVGCVDGLRVWMWRCCGGVTL